MDGPRTNFKKRTSIVDEICEDHDRIMILLNELIECRAWRKTRSRQLSALIGAHHLAEEETLYAGLLSKLSRKVGQAVAFHAVLDDLIHKIEMNDGRDGAVQYELLLLRHLLLQHFDAEETELLEYLLENHSIEGQQKLGREYRVSFDTALDELRFDHNPSRKNRPNERSQMAVIDI